MLFSVLLGTGVQLIALTLCILFLACLGFVYQSHRGNIITMMVVVFVFTGSINGFYTARFYKYFKVTLLPYARVPIGCFARASAI
jgi:hypothetical protein